MDDHILGRVGLESVDSSYLVAQSHIKHAAKRGKILRFLIKKLSKATDNFTSLKNKISAEVTKCVS